MPSAFPGSPRILKGALAVYPEQTPGTQPKIIVFQYNPENMKRTLAARSQPPDKTNAGGAREEALRVFGPPIETITMTVQLSAADQLAEPDSNRAVVENGLQPALATLELLLYPSSKTVQQQKQQARQGKVQVHPADLPLTLLVWGKARVVPVLITSFSVSEEGFDVNLNPIEAKVDLGLKVLTYLELKNNSLGIDAFNSYQSQKEQLAQLMQSQESDGRVRGLLPA
jgi:hypothetical protein